MAKDISFGRDSSKLVISQNVPLDSLIEGISVKREYEVIVYNAVAAVEQSPWLDINSRILDCHETEIVNLHQRPKEKKPSFAKDIVDAAGGAGIGAIFGYYKGGVWGVILPVVGAVAAKAIPRAYDFIAKKRERKIGERRKMAIKGSDLGHKSSMKINISGGTTIYFGSCHYLNRFSLEDEVDKNAKETKKARESVAHEEEIVRKLILDLPDTPNGAPGNPKLEEYNKIIGFMRQYSEVFKSREGVVYLHNTVEIGSTYKKNPKAMAGGGALCHILERLIGLESQGGTDMQRAARKVIDLIGGRYAHVGDICVLLGETCEKSIKEVKEEVKKAFQNRGLILQNSVSIDLSGIVEKRREEIQKEHPTTEEAQPYFQENVNIPVCIVDKINGDHYYGILEVNTENSMIEPSRFVDAGKHKIFTV